LVFIINYALFGAKVFFSVRFNRIVRTFIKFQPIKQMAYNIASLLLYWKNLTIMIIYFLIRMLFYLNEFYYLLLINIFYYWIKLWLQKKVHLSSLRLELNFRQFRWFLTLINITNLNHYPCASTFQNIFNTLTLEKKYLK
jgi:hypothetical protein